MLGLGQPPVLLKWGRRFVVTQAALIFQRSIDRCINSQQRPRLPYSYDRLGCTTPASEITSSSCLRWPRTSVAIEVRVAGRSWACGGREFHLSAISRGKRGRGELKISIVAVTFWFGCGVANDESQAA